MTLDYTKVDQVNIAMLDYINEITNDFDKAYTTSGITKSSSALAIISKANENLKKLVPRKLWSFITWWQNIICHQGVLNLNSYPLSARDITPRVRSQQTRQ